MFHTIKVLSMQLDKFEYRLFFLLLYLLGWIISNATGITGKKKKLSLLVFKGKKGVLILYDLFFEL